MFQPLCVLKGADFAIMGVTSLTCTHRIVRWVWRWFYPMPFNMCDICIALCVFTLHRPLRKSTEWRLLETTVLRWRGIFIFPGELLKEIYKAHAMLGCGRNWSENVRNSDCALETWCWEECTGWRLKGRAVDTSGVEKHQSVCVWFI